MAKGLNVPPSEAANISNWFQLVGGAFVMMTFLAGHNSSGTADKHTPVLWDCLMVTRVTTFVVRGRFS